MVWLFILAALATPPPQQDTPPTPSKDVRERLSQHFERVKLPMAGTTREALVHVPRSARGTNKRLPVVFSLHGGREKTAVDMVPNWAEQLDQNFILVLPSGWYERGEVGWASQAQNTHGDPMRDLKFFHALKKHVIANYPANPDRFYLTGFSNGGHETMWTLCQRPELFDGYGVVMKSIHRKNEAVCPKPTKANVRPLLYVAATKDKNWEGNEDFRTARRTAEIFRNRNGCSNQTFAHKTFDRPGDATFVQAQSYLCSRAPFAHYIIDGSGHSWPRKRGGPRRAEHSTDINMSDELLEFFNIPRPPTAD